MSTVLKMHTTWNVFLPLIINIAQVVVEGFVPFSSPTSAPQASAPTMLGFVAVVLLMMANIIV